MYNGVHFRSLFGVFLLEQSTVLRQLSSAQKPPSYGAAAGRQRFLFLNEVFKDVVASVSSEWISITSCRGVGPQEKIHLHSLEQIYIIHTRVIYLKTELRLNILIFNRS